MKDLNLFVWLMQLGLTVACPLAGFTLAAVWLRQRFDLGIWVIFVGVGIGFLSAVSGFRSTLQIMNRMSKSSKDDNAPPPLSFNDHQ